MPVPLLMLYEPVNGESRMHEHPALKLTDAERAAGVTPVNFGYAPGNVKRHGAIGDGITDDTQAIKDAFTVGRQYQFVYFPPGTYLISDTCITIIFSDTRMSIFGEPRQSIILNKAGTGKPSIQLLGASYWDIRGLVFIGATTFPNVGIQLLADGSANRCAYGVIKNIVCQTNGYGIRIQDTNTIAIEDYEYWPSGGSSFGGSIDTNGQPGGILADGSGAVNSVYLKNINISGLNTIANGGCGIKADGSVAGAPFQDWLIDGLNCEAGPVTTRRAIWMRNCANGRLRNTFTENMQVLFDYGTRHMDAVIQAGGSGTVEVAETGQFCTKIHVHDSVGLSYTCSAGNIECEQTNNSWQVAPGNADVSTDRVQINTRTTGNTLEADVIGARGLKERNRSVAMGEWTSRTFTAADYTASAGNWTLTSPDQLNLQYAQLGKTAFLNGNLDQTTVSATPVQLTLAIPGSLVSAKAQKFSMFYTEDNGTTTKQGIILVTAGGTTLGFRRDLAGTAWATTANLTGIAFCIAIEVQ